MIDLVWGLVLSVAAFVFIMITVIVIGRSVGRWFGPKDQ
jgi:hypothetical protein